MYVQEHITVSASSVSGFIHVNYVTTADTWPMHLM